jgi:hypothetical protein
MRQRACFKSAMIIGVIIVLKSYPSYATTIRDYRFLTAEMNSPDHTIARIVLRKFFLNDKEYYLAANPRTLESELVPAGKYPILKRTLKEIQAKNGDLAYFKVLRRAGENSRRLLNAGITHILSRRPGMYITADLCPTRRPLDRLFFMQLVSTCGKRGEAVPVAIALSGLWLKKHAQDLRWIQEREQKGDIEVIWINHTYHHRYQKKEPWWRNFLLDRKKNDIHAEIILNEIAMIESGLLPSLFFRFPGLVSDRKLFAQVTDMGLIPVGSDAWLGKKQWPREGSIILVHANGQEPVGTKRFSRYLASRRKDIVRGRMLFLDLRKGLSEIFNRKT